MGQYYINDGKNMMLTENLIHIIKSAKRYIKVSSFIMEDKTIVSELCNVASTGKVAVFVISNRNNKEGEEYRATSAQKEDANPEGIHSHPVFLQKLFYSGVHVRLLDNLHAKFIISDGDNGILMSANIASNSLIRNVETGISVSKNDLKDLELIFDTMYNYADIVQFVKSDKSDVVKKSIRKIPEQIFNNIKGNIKLTALSRYNTNLSDCHQTTLYDSLIEIIDNANSFIYIVSWVFKDKSNSLIRLQNSISKALRRGVKITLFYNQLVPPYNLPLQKKFIEDMGIKGCDAYSNNNNHSKCVLSEKEGILFTANIDGNNGLLEGFEVGCLMDKDQHQCAIGHVNEMIKKSLIK